MTTTKLENLDSDLLDKATGGSGTKDAVSRSAADLGRGTGSPSGGRDATSSGSGDLGREQQGR